MMTRSHLLSVPISKSDVHQIKVKGTLANLLETEALNEWHGWAPLMSQLRNSIRMSVDIEVVNRSEEIPLDATSDFEMAHEILNSVKLPADPCWLEWRPSDIDPDDHQRAGMLVQKEDGILCVTTALVQIGGNRVFWNAASAYACPINGLGIKWRWGEKQHLTPRIWERAAMIGLGIACRLLILLTAHNSPVIRDPIKDFERLNRQRVKSGKLALLSFQPVRWNVDRLERTLGKVPSSCERADTSPHLCRGHFKMLKSGRVWWNAHWRALRGELPPQGGRDHEVKAIGDKATP